MRFGFARLRDESGLSMVEVVISSALFIVLLAAVLQTLDSGTRTESEQQARNDALVGLRAAMTRITRDTRQATYLAPSCPATPRCSSRSELDIDTIKTGDPAPQRVVYELVGGEIRRTEGTGATVTLIDRITTTTPFCYDPPDCLVSGPPLQPSSVRIYLELTPIALGRGAITLATDVQLRNL